MTSAALLTPTDHVRFDQPRMPEVAAAPRVIAPLLRSVAKELTHATSQKAFGALAAQFERHAEHLEVDIDAPTMAVRDGVVTVTTTSPFGTVLVVPAPACDETTIGTHIAAALTAGNRVSLGTFGAIDSSASLFYAILTGILTSDLFAVLSPGSGWTAPGRQCVFVVTPDAAFANDLPWWTHNAGGDDQAAVGDLVRFYRRSSSIQMPVRTSPHRGLAW